jgi:hypothetical protein
VDIGSEESSRISALFAKNANRSIITIDIKANAAVGYLAKLPESLSAGFVLPIETLQLWNG